MQNHCQKIRMVILWMCPHLQMTFKQMKICYQRMDQPQSQYSFGINLMCLRDPQDDRVLPAACIPGVQDEETELPPAAYIPGVQDEETELPPAQVAEECDVSDLTVQMEDLMVDFAQPEHGRYFGKVSAILRMDVALPTEAEGVVDNLSAERGKSCSLIIKCH